MADFRIAHLAFRKSNVGAARAQFAAGIIAVESIVKRRARQQRSIAVFFCLRFAARVDAPAIANDEHDRASHVRTLRRLGRSTRASFSCICGKTNEVAKSIAGTVVSGGLRRARSFVLSALGSAKTVRNYSPCWRGARARTRCPDAHV